MKLSRTYAITLVAGFAIMLAGILLAVLTPYADKIIQSGLITVGMVMAVIAFLRMMRSREGPVKDELTRKIADRAAAVSWFYTLLALLAVYWLNYFNVIAFSVNGVILVTYAVMVGTMILMQQIYWRRGDTV